MKTLIVSSIAIVGLLLAGLQHQQLRELHAENVTLQQSSAEASRLKADLDKSAIDQSQDEAEIGRLREENHDLLKLRNEVNQLREARAQFEKVSAENQRLQSIAKNAAKTDSKQSMQPIVVRMVDLVNRGESTPEDAIQTFLWALRERNSDVLSHCATPKMSSQFQRYLKERNSQPFDNFVSIEIVARREPKPNMVQLGVQLDFIDNSQSPEKQSVDLTLQDGEWRVDSAGN
jgi:hypothetical protein